MVTKPDVTRNHVEVAKRFLRSAMKHLKYTDEAHSYVESALLALEEVG